MPTQTPIATKPTQSRSPDGTLAKYWAKRDFNVTAEPRGEQAPAADRLTFVIQKHAASSLHYDFRLELDGVLLSWAVPKGPSLDPADKRLAVRTEDHPLSYASFEGVIPPKQYGAGTVIVWDNGSWKPVGDPRKGLEEGKLMFELHGQKLQGLWELVNITKPGAKQEQWLLFKKRGDGYVRPRAEYDVVNALPDSVIAKPLLGAKVKAPASAKKPVKRATGARAASKHSGIPGAVKAPMPEKLQPQLHACKGHGRG